jgi:preprotein translocase subunit SecF
MTFLQWKRLYMWRTILLVIWLFLHVFEDSMVNYLFFVAFGLLTGYMSSLYKNNKLQFKDLFIKK